MPQSCKWDRPLDPLLTENSSKNVKIVVGIVYNDTNWSKLSQTRDYKEDQNCTVHKNTKFEEPLNLKFKIVCSVVYVCRVKPLNTQRWNPIKIFG